jgi:hypothetical protein
LADGPASASTEERCGTIALNSTSEATMRTLARYGALLALTTGTALANERVERERHDTDELQPLPFRLPCQPTPIAHPDDSAYGANPAGLDAVFSDIAVCDFPCPSSGVDGSGQPCASWHGGANVTTRFQIRLFVSQAEPWAPTLKDCFTYAGASLIWGTLSSQCYSIDALGAHYEPLWGDFCPRNHSAAACPCNAQISEGIDVVRTCRAAPDNHCSPETWAAMCGRSVACVDDSACLAADPGENDCMGGVCVGSRTTACTSSADCAAVQRNLTCGDDGVCQCRPKSSCVGPEHTRDPARWDCGCISDGCDGVIGCLTGPRACINPTTALTGGAGCQGAGDGRSWFCDTTVNHCRCAHARAACPSLSGLFYDGCYWVHCGDADSSELTD